MESNHEIIIWEGGVPNRFYFWCLYNQISQITEQEITLAWLITLTIYSNKDVVPVSSSHAYIYVRTVDHVTYVCYYESGVFILRFTDRIGDDGAMESSFAQQEFEEMRRYVHIHTWSRNSCTFQIWFQKDSWISCSFYSSSIPIHVFLDCIDYVTILDS